MRFFSTFCALIPVSPSKVAGLLALTLLVPLVLAACQVIVVPAGASVTIEGMPATAPTAPTVAVTAPTPTAPPTPLAAAAPPASTQMTAASLRVTLNQLLGEHVLLAASATNNALGGRTAGFEAAAAALDVNSVDLATAIGSIYGATAGDAFLPLWRTHIGFFVDYTQAVAAGDEAKRTEALANLAQYAQDFGAFLAAANPNLTQSAVAEALGPHVGTLTSVIDAQGAGDPERAFTALRDAYAHMRMIGQALAGAISAQFPDQFPGAVISPAADLQVALNGLLAEHTYLAALAASAAIGDRQAEFAAAAAALDANSVDLAAALTSVYGTAAGDAFLPLWRTHIGFFVDYTLAAAQDDAAGREEALVKLIQYGQDFGAFLAAANPHLGQSAVAELLGPHVTTLTAVIDALAAKDAVATYGELRAAYAHMRMIADPLAAAITTQFPEQFGIATGEASTDDDHMHTMDDSGDEAMNVMAEASAETLAAEVSATAGDAVQPLMSAGLLRSTLRNLLGEHTLLTASAADAFLRGRTAEFEAAAAALDANAVDVAAAIGTVYGDAAAEAFLPLWRAHITMLVDYLSGVSAGDKAQQQQALADLAQYAQDFGAFLQAANPNLPQMAVADLLRSHVTTLVVLIDALATVTPQASGDQQSAYPALRLAYDHMDMHATALADGISRQFPGLLTGSADSGAADLQAALNGLLAEHTYLLAKSAAAALAARNIEFEAAAGALDQNSQELATAIGAIYGEEAGDAFLPLWRKHIGFFIAYTLALVEADSTAQAQALADLTVYAQDLGAFLQSANPALPPDVVAGLVGMHAETTIAVIDAAATEEFTAFYTNLRTAYAHMAMIANPLAAAISTQFPAQFGDERTEGQRREGQRTEGEMATDAGNATVVIDTFAFSPSRLEIPVGTTVVWRNQDGADHTVTAGTPETKDARFASPLFNQGEEYTFTFTEAGEFPYFCQRHPAMRGVIVVVPAP